MEPNVHLIINNVFSIISIVILSGVVLFTFLNGRKNATNIFTALGFLMAIVFYVSHTIGISVADPILSRDILMFNLCMFPAGMFQLHALLSMTGRVKEQRIMLWLIYIVAIGLVIFFLLFPNLFLLPSVPKMYFPNYYNPGVLNWTRVFFLEVIVLGYSLYILFSARKRTEKAIERNQYTFFILALILFYIVIVIPNFLVYNIPIDPLWGSLAAFVFVIPFGYAAIKYQLFNIKVVAKQAFLYSIAVGAIGGFITLLNYARDLIATIYPDFPIWTTYLFSSFLAVTMGVFVWRKLRESDLLKYEFITTVTHKFRTPLTHIKWATENISKAQSISELKDQIGYIESANTKLVELTNLLVNVSETEDESSDYRLEQSDLSPVAEEVAKDVEASWESRHVSIIRNLPRGMVASFDAVRIRFVLQTLLENAVHYSPDGSTISLVVVRQGSHIVCSVKDSGIGIPKSELSQLFTKFYRGPEARLADTEGMGIGLYIARQIITRHKGKIWAESEGTDKGSTFSFSLPVA